MYRNASYHQLLIVSNQVLAFFLSSFSFQVLFFLQYICCRHVVFRITNRAKYRSYILLLKSVYTRLLFVVVYYSKRESMAAFFAKGGTRKEGRKKAPCEVCEHVCSHPTLISLLLASKTHNASKNYSDLKNGLYFLFIMVKNNQKWSSLEYQTMFPHCNRNFDPFHFRKIGIFRQNRYSKN